MHLLHRALARPAGLLIACALGAGSAASQYAERPSLAGSGAPDVDVSGRSVKNKRVRAVHSDDPSQAGTTAWMFQRDPFLAYQLGRNLNFREFRTRDGIFSASVSGLGGPMPDGTTAKITKNNQTSCLGCHNQPYGNPGGAASFAKDSGRARNSPHYYGAGIVEMLALQVRADILGQLDTGGDGWVSAAEAAAAGPSVRVRTGPGGRTIDYGDPRLSGGSTGVPALNNIFRVWYVDASGRVVKGAKQVDGVATHGYNFEMVVWGWGQGPGRSALNPTNRAFLWDPLESHGGLEADDPTTNVDADGDGISERSLAGAIQFPVTHSTPDKGAVRDPIGFSLDDPDGDGYLCEISEGDLDLGEWFMLNAPRPAFAGTPEEFAEGVALMRRMECASCHVPNWQIRPRGGAFDGDRRLFDLKTTWNEKERRLEGELVRLYTKNGAAYARDFRGFAVEGFFSDLKHHEMGERYAEIGYDGTVNTLWRTAILWGVGSGFPWDHDGASLTLEASILRHGGEAEGARAAWLAATPEERERLLAFLGKLVLYDVESLPADIDGDGSISDRFMVAGMDTGMERFNAEWLFAVPLKIQGPWVNIDGRTITSYCGTNIDDAYGQNLPYRRDSDDDGWPDVWDHAPGTAGYKNGVQ